MCIRDSQQTLHPMAKGLPPFTPLDLTAIGLAQTANGASFHVTADETRTTLNFRLSCSDGTEAETALGVEVHPTYGELWWAYNNYEPVFTATPGFLFFLGAHTCLLYTSDAADERSSVDLGGRRIIKKKKIVTTD